MSILSQKLQSHPLIKILVDLRGNERACIYTEPLWGIPYNLYIPFFTVYQHALGVSDRQIGILLSLSMFMQVITMPLGGLLTDRFGRRRTTFYVDILVWSVPVLIWAFAQSFTWFLAAMLFNGMWQITSISWTCLLVEDCDKNKLVPIFTWATICGLLAVFFAPLSGLLVSRVGIIPAMRVLLLIAFSLMTAKFIILFIFSHETNQGRIQMQATRHASPGQFLSEYRQLAVKMARNPRTWHLLAFLVLFNVGSTILTNFFALYATLSLNTPEPYLAYFPIGRAVIMLIFIFTIQTVLNRHSFKVPMIAGLIIYVLSQLVLLNAPVGRPGFLWLYILGEALAYALVVPQKDSLIVLFIDPEERPRQVSLLYLAMTAISTPFGWIAGELSQRSRQWPFLLNMVLFALCVLLVIRLRPASADKQEA
ncbi:MAG: MFS transporter [Clostridiaceae bacterium]|nr:MFS transporter [Clostridiaceae bacterium]